MRASLISTVLCCTSATVFDVELSNDVYSLGITRDLRVKFDYDRLIQTVRERGWVIIPVFGGLASSEEIMRHNTGLTDQEVEEPYFDIHMVQLMRKHNLHRQYIVDTQEQDVELAEVISILLPNSVVVNVTTQPYIVTTGNNLRGSDSISSAPRDYSDCSSFPCQGYLYKDETPTDYKALGVNAKRVWEEFGVRGEGVRYIIQEMGLVGTAIHNEIVQPRILINPDTDDSNHKTGVAGINLSKHDGCGTEGIAPSVDSYIDVTWEETTNGLNTYEELMKIVRPGDVFSGSWAFGYGGWMAEEQRKYDPNCDGCDWPVVFSTVDNRAFNVLAELGVTVFMASGNGGTNLGSEFFEKYHPISSRGPQTAAIVTGWDPMEDNPFLYSNYVSNASCKQDFIDVQFASWGSHVVTTSTGSDGYQTGFSGSSSATPIAAGAALLIQSAAKKYLGAPLTPSEVINLLRNTGNELNNSGPYQYKDVTLLRSPDAYAAVKRVVEMANSISETDEPTLPSVCYQDSTTVPTKPDTEFCAYVQ